MERKAKFFSTLKYQWLKSKRYRKSIHYVQIGTTGWTYIHMRIIMMPLAVMIYGKLANKKTNCRFNNAAIMKSNYIAKKTKETSDWIGSTLKVQNHEGCKVQKTRPS